MADRHFLPGVGAASVFSSTFGAFQSCTDSLSDSNGASSPISTVWKDMAVLCMSHQHRWVHVFVCACVCSCVRVRACVHLCTRECLSHLCVRRVSEALRVTAKQLAVLVVLLLGVVAVGAAQRGAAAVQAALRQAVHPTAAPTHTHGVTQRQGQRFTARSAQAVAQLQRVEALVLTLTLAAPERGVRGQGSSLG